MLLTACFVPAVCSVNEAKVTNVHGTASYKETEDKEICTVKM